MFPVICNTLVPTNTVHKDPQVYASHMTQFIYQKVYDYIIEFSKDNGYTPSLEDIRVEFDWKSKNSASRHIDRLSEKGMLEKDPKGRIKFPKELLKFPPKK